VCLAHLMAVIQSFRFLGRRGWCNDSDDRVTTGQ